MHKRTYFQWIGVVVLGLVLPGQAVVGQPADAPRLVREIYVPAEALDVIFQASGQRIFLGREEYDEMVQRAARSPETPAPVAYTMVAANYQAAIEGQRARIAGELIIDVVAPGLQAIPLALADVGIQAATLDEQPATLGRSPDGQSVLLFIEGEGRHQLNLQLTVPVDIAAAQQILKYHLPTAATGRIELTVPGNVEIKRGGQVVQRETDPQAEVTRFDLLPDVAATELVLSLNNLQTQEDRVVLARGVAVAEITENYERLHVTASLRVQHGATDQFRFSVPAGFDITDVHSTLLSRWEVTENEGQRILQVTLQEPVTDTALINVSAQRVASSFRDWTMPRLQPLDVASASFMLGVLIDPQLQADVLQTEDLIPIDVQVLTAALPESIFAAEAGAPALQPIAAFYAPLNQYVATAEFSKPAGRINVIGNTLLIVADSGLSASGGFALMPIAEKIFDCNFSVPDGWRVTEVTYGDGQPLVFEPFVDDDGTTRIRVDLSTGVQPGDVYNVYFRAEQVPSDWLGTWQTQQIQMPRFAINEATTTRGAVAVVMQDDLEVRLEETTGLTPLDAQRQAEFRLGDVKTDLAFRYDAADFSATLDVQRLPARVTAEAFSFLKITPGVLRAHYELIYDIKAARTRSLSFSLPAASPAEVAIRGLDGLVIKDESSSITEEGRVWNVDLAAAVTGTVRLEVTFQQRLAMSDPTDEAGSSELLEEHQLPVIRAVDVDYQTGAVAVEGHAELEVAVATDARKVDVGELVGADYRPGRRLLGAYGYIGQPAAVLVDVTRPATYGLPSAIVERAELVTTVATHGLAQSIARFHLRTKASFLELELPQASTLWSVFLDGQPSKPQQVGQRILVSLPMGQEGSLRDLQVVYETPIRELGVQGDFDLAAPQLFLRSRPGDPAVELPVADLAWYVGLPPRYQMTASDGSVFADLSHPLTAQQLAIRGAAPGRVTRNVLGGLAALALSPVMAAREAARYGGDDAVTEMPQDSWSFRNDPSADAGMPDAEMSNEAIVDEAVVVDELDIDKAMPDAEDLFQEQAPAAPDAPPADGEPTPSMLGQTQTAPPTGTAGEPAAQTRGGTVITGVAERGEKADGRLWALEGLRSLPIAFQMPEQRLAFQSLGAHPELQVTVVDSRRVHLAAWTVALGVLVIGGWLQSSPASTKWSYLLVVAVLTAVIPLLADWRGVMAEFFDPAFAAVLLLGAWYLLRAIGLGIRRRLGSRLVVATASSLVVAGLLSFAGEPSWAAPPETELGPLTIRLDDTTPISIPPDAVVIPFDANDPAVIADPGRGDGKILVGYDKYLQLWNLAYPDERLQRPQLPAAFAVAAAQWKTRLDASGLVVSGTLLVEVFQDGPVSVMLPLEGGILSAAQVDGQPARVQIIAPESQAPAAANQQAETVPASNLMAVYLAGQGRYQINLAIRFGLTRQGGWYVAQGRLPPAASNALEIAVPQAATEIRLAGVSDQTSFTTAQDDQTIDATLRATQPFRIQWRPQVTSSTVDRALTARSSVVFDIQEDRLRAVWQLDLGFPGNQRDVFTIGIPEGYTVEQVSGENLRDWKVDGGQMHVQLLAAVRDNQQLVLHLARTLPNSVVAARAEFQFPRVEVVDAVLHEGRMAIRRSPWIELQTLEATGVARTEFTSVTIAAQQGTESPLGIQPYQAYEFNGTGFQLRFAASPIVRQLRAEIQTLLRIAELERNLESRILLQPEGRPVFQVQVQMPDDLQIESVDAPAPFRWSSRSSDGVQNVSLFLAAGQSGPFEIVVTGRLGARGAVPSVPLPQIVLPQADRQVTQIAIQTDPSFDVTLSDLVNCETTLLQSTYGWLGENQRTLARAAVRSANDAFSGQVQLVRRTPQIRSQTISNLRVTDRAFEETLLLDFTIENSGVRQVVFRLPARLASAQIQAPMLRTKTVVAVENTDEVRVTLDLQDEVMGQFRVLVESDRLLVSQQQTVAIPVVDTGRVERQFVCLESAGNSEVEVASRVGLERLTREQRQWAALASVLGTGITEAFVVTPTANQPELTVQIRNRQTVETVGASIAFAETLLVVDANGAYRGRQRYQVDNRIEQFLEVVLPPGATLWTARVAGEPVKPVADTNNHVRIPLVKTAEGDRDYRVELKYGGQMPGFGNFASVQFPLMQTVNIKVAESQVRLRLPDSYRWSQFDGSMRLVENERELISGYLDYKSEQVEGFLSQLASSNPFTRVRAQKNIAEAYQEFSQLQQSKSYFAREQAIRGKIQSNLKKLKQAQVHFERQSGVQTNEFDNRQQLNEWFAEQSNGLSRNQVIQQAENFDRTVIQDARQSKNGRDIVYQQEWIDQNKLSNVPADAKADSGRIVFDATGKGIETRSSQLAVPQQQQRVLEELKEVEEEQKSVTASSSRDAESRVQEFQRRYNAQQEGLPSVNFQVDPAGGRRDASATLEAEAAEGRGRWKFRVNVGDSDATGSGESQDSGQPPASGPMSSDGAAIMSGGIGGGGFYDDSGVASGQGLGNGQAIDGQTPAPTGLVSLDVDLPVRGTEYLFTTPRGNIAIEAQAIDGSFASRMLRSGGWLLALVVGLVAMKKIGQRR